MNKSKKSYMNLNKAELAAATADLSAGAVPPGEPLTLDERSKWERAAARGAVSVHIGSNRPKVGEGSVVVPVSLEASLFRRVIAFARDAGVKRSEVVSRALELLVDGETELGGAKFAVRKPPGVGVGVKTGKMRVRT